MSFPQTPLGITTQIDAGGWTDITSFVRGDGLNAVAISRGISSSGGTVADRGTCALTLDNNDGRFSSRNPRSPLFGKIGRNTAIKVGVAYGTPWLDVPYGSTLAATTPDSTALSITGDIDVRVDATLAAWGDGNVPLIGKTDGTTGFSWWLLITNTGCLQLAWTPDNLTLNEATSTMPVGLAPWQRQSLRATLDVNNGTGGWTATFYTSATAGTSGPWTQLGTAVTASGTTSIYDSTVPLRTGDISALGYAQTARRIHAAQVRSGIGGTVVANPDFGAQTVGATSFVDSAGCTWTVPAGGITNVYPRFAGRVPSWPPQWTTGGKDVTTPINAAGRLQQLGQGQRPLQSTLRRFIPTQPNVAAYWPMEDGPSATQAASGLVGGQAMQASGLSFAQDSTLPGSDPMPTTGAKVSWSAPITNVPAGAFRAEMMLNIPQPLTGTAIPLRIQTTGTYRTIYVTMDTTGGALIQFDPSDGGAIGGFAVTNPNANTPMWQSWQRLVVTLAQNGTGIDVTFGFINDIADNGWFLATSTMPSSTLGSPTRIFGTYGTELQGTTIGHVAVYADSSLEWTGPSRTEVNGQAGETAAARMARLCDEGQVPASVAGLAADTVLMGPQPHGKLVDVVTDAVTADEAYLTEALEFDGLRMRTRASLYNQTSVLDLDYTASPQPLMAPLTPTDDDQQLVNDSTVTRTNGSSGRFVQDTGSLSVQDPPNGVGLYDENVTRNLWVDGQAAQSAGWRVHIGTWDEARFPAVTIYVEKNPSLIPAVCAIDTGSRIRITGTLPSWLPAGPIDLLVLGYQETLAQFAWHITYACVPYGPYQVGVRDDASRGRRDTSGSKLAAAVTASATTLSVATTNGPMWTSNPADYPFDLAVGGEVVTARAAGVALDLVDGTFESGVAGWTPTGGTFVPSADARTGTGAGLLTVTGTPTQAFVRPDTAHYIPVTAGTEYRCSLWVKASTTVSAMAAIDWRDASQAALSTTSGTSTTLTAGVWTPLTVTGTAPASAAYARPGPTITGSPAAGTTLGVDDMATVATSTYTTSPQSMTVTRAVNGISKPQAINAPISLAQPTIRAL